jgi:asparaginyl-tRNA synthetase
MKKLYINDILNNKIEKDIELFCWIKNKRDFGKILFFDVVDSTGEIGVVIKKEYFHDKDLSFISRIPEESSIKIIGKIEKAKDKLQIIAKKIEVIGLAELNLSPHPRKEFKIFDKKYTNHILNYKHLYLRNRKIMAIMRLKRILIQSFREWLDEKGFLEIDTPIITQATLYSDNETFKIDYFGTPAYLSQCAGLYLDAALHAFEKVYTVTPAFRAEPSKSKRHNSEFWHIKAQLAFANLGEMMNLVSQMIYEVAKKFNSKGKKELEELGIKINIEKLKPPYKKITYKEAVDILKKDGKDFIFGNNLGADEEKIISLKFKSPFYVVGLPKTVEPFPYSIDKSNPEFTKTADLLVPEGYGEILGIAEFITDFNEIMKRIKEKNKDKQIERIKWYVELKKYGCVPHSGFGMGIERVLRWLLKLDHIKDTFLFPRTYNKVPYP